ncbi:MAG: protein phosphatase 2C domain-containing protein [Gemmatimonadota bacterium]|nr:protein phosphatase 2C domain-containing protein [Gemmatimonadota bacterium]
MIHFEGINVDVRGRTDVGKIRRVNQDQYLVAALHKVIDIHDTSLPPSYRERFDSGARALLFLVADGVGGGPSGERASSLTLDSIMRYVTNSMRCFYKLDQLASLDLMGELATSIQESHVAVRAESESDPEAHGMATTITMAHVLWPRVYIVHIGDSRCYHLRGGSLAQITHDQTVSQALVDAGALTEEQAVTSPYSSVLTQAVGASDELEPALSTLEMSPGDTLLMCTDGLTKHVSRQAITEILGAHPTAEAASVALIEAALEGGGTDNVTALVARFIGP